MSTLDLHQSEHSDPHGDAWAKLDLLLPVTPRPFWARLPWYLPAMIAIGLGLAFLMTDRLFQTNTQWNIMARTFGAHSQPVWGGLFLLTGSIHVALKAIRHPWRWITAFTLVAMFGYMAASLTVSAGFLSTGTIAYGGYALLAIWAVVRPH